MRDTENVGTRNAMEDDKIINEKEKKKKRMIAKKDTLVGSSWVNMWN